MRTIKGFNHGGRVSTRRLLGCLLSLLAVTGFAPNARAERVFTSRFTTNDNGDVQIIGNALLSCTQGANNPPATCAATVPVNGTGSSAANLNDNAYTMRPVNTAGGTISSSSADLALPTGSSILWAGLYWGADTSAGTTGAAAANAAARNQIRFAIPGGAYQTVTATQVDAAAGAASRYSAFVAVTALVQAGGAGTYRVADIQAGTGQDRYAGWSLVIVVRDPAQPLRNLTIFDGLQTVNTSAPTVNIAVSGFRTPLTGAFTARVGAVTYEGDLGSTGDQFKINGINLSNAVNPTTNVFNSTISRLGTNITAKNPNFINQMGFDADVFDASGILANGATGATLTFTTSDETYYPAVLTFANDVYQPVIEGNVIKTVTDLNGGSVLPGDVLQYTVALSNTGNDAATNVVLSDAIPANTTYVPNSLVVLTGANAGAKTDASGDDQGNFSAGSAVFRLGTGANAGVGGSLAINAATSVTFRVTVNAGVAAGTSISNQASVAFTSATLGTAFTSLSDGDPNTAGNQPTTVVVGSAQSRLGIDKDSTPNPVVAGQNITYTLHVTNSGPSDATNVIVSDPLAAATTFVSASAPAAWTIAAPAVGSSGNVQFSAAVLPVGNYDLVIVAKVVAGTLGGSVIGNTATTTAANDPSGAHIGATNTTVANSGDLSLSKNADATVGQGQQVGYTVQLNNPGPDAATGVVVSDPLPAGTTFTSASAPPGWSVTAPAVGSAGNVVFSIASLPPGAYSFAIVATASTTAVLGSTITNTATVTSTSADSNTANHSASAGTLVQNPVPGVAKSFTPAAVGSGVASTMRITITNNAAVPVSGIAISDILPATPGQMHVTNPVTGVNNTCGGTFTAASNATSVALAGTGPLAAGASCFVEVNVAATTVGNYSNTTGNVTSTQTPTGPTATASLAVGVLNAPTTSKSFAPGSVQLGAAAQMTIAFGNPNTTPITGVAFLDNYPDGILNANANVVASNSCGGTATTATGGNSLQLAGGTIPVVGCSIVVNVIASAIGSSVNSTGPITSSNAQSGAGGSGTLAITPLTAPGTSKSFNPSTIARGGSTQMTIALSNPNSSPITLTGFSDTYPGGIANANAAVVVSNSCSGTLTANPGDGMLALSGGVIASNASCSIVVNVVATADGPQVNSSGPITSSNAQTGAGANGTLTVTPVADLAISKSDGVTSAIPGTAVTYTIVATNAGPSDATAAKVADILPAAIINASWTCSAAGAANCAPAGIGNIDTLVGIPVGDSVTFILTGTIRAAASGVVSNTVAIAAAAGIGDPVAGNNSATDSDTLTPSADIETVKTGTAAVDFGGPVSYSVIVTNHGPSDANATTFIDAVPNVISAVTAGCGSATAGAACGPTSVAGNTVNSVITSLPANSSVTFTINATAPTSGGSIANTASANPAVGTTDPNPGNNSSTATTTVRQPQLALTKSATPNPFVIGQPASYTIGVTNAGTGATSGNITLADTLPDGITLADASGANWSCTGTTTLSCTFIGTLGAGASTTLTLGVDVAVDAISGTNTATASGGGDSGCPLATRCSGTTPNVPVNPAADIAVTKTVDNATPNVGDTVTFTVSATNNGPSDATGVQIIDALPSGLAFVSATPAQGTYDDGTGVWTAGALANGASTTLQIQADVLATGALTNTATRTGGDQLDPNSANNSATAQINGLPSADLQVMKAVSNPAPNIGTNVLYTITLTNAGPNDASGVIIDDPLPPGLLFVASTPSQGTYDDTSGVWTAGALANGAQATLAISATVMLAGDITNTASVAAADQHDPNPANNSGGVTINGQSADIQVVKTVDDANPVRGDTISFTVTATNNGPSSATGVAITDALPAGLALISSTPSQGDYDNTSGIWTIGSLDAAGVGATATLTIVASVDTDAGFTNTANLSASDQPDPNPANNSSSVAVIPVASADIEIVKSGPAGAVAGQNVSYTLAVTNHGPSDATDVSLDDPAPIGLSFVSADAPCAGGFPCDLGTLANGATVTINATFALPGSFVDASIANTASVTSPVQDPDAGNNTSTITTPVVLQADIETVKTGPATVSADGALTYTVQVTNNGPSDANGSAFSDPVPAAIAAVTATCTASGDAVCGVVGIAGNNVSSTITTLPSGASVIFTINGSAPADGGTLTNTASAQPPTGVTDPDPGNNDDSVDTDVGALADISVLKSGPASATPGTTVPYTLTVANAGPSAAAAVSLTDAIPAGLVFVSATAPCAGGFPCALGDLAAGATAEVTVNLGVPAGYIGTISNTATATSTTADPNPDDNSSTAVTPTLAIADLAVIKSGPANVVAGAPITYTVIASNMGPSDATGANFSDPVPAGISGVGATCSSPVGGAVCGAVGIAGNSVTSTITSLPNGASVTFTINGIAPANSATLSNVATISAAPGTNDPDAANNSSSVDTTINASADLALVKTGSSTIASGATLSYTLLISNAGPSAADGATWSDAVPGGISGVSATCGTPSGGAVCAAPGIAGNTVSGSVPTLPAGASVTITISGAAPFGAQTLTNTASVTAPPGTADPNPANNSDSVDTTVGGAADIAVVKTVDTAAPNVGDTVIFTLTATNNGPDDASGVALTDNLPPGLGFIAATPSQGTYASATGAWTIGALANGASVSLTLSASVDQPGALTNTVAVSAAEQPDPDTSNNNAGAAVNAGASADIAVAKIVDNATPNVGSQVTYTISATNNGPNDASAIEITDSLPVGLSFVSAIAAQGTFDSSSGVWAVGSLANGASSSLAIIVTVDQPGALTNSATITHEDQFDPVGANNQAGTTINGEQADLAVSKTVDDATPDIGSDVTFTISVHNNGPSDATNVALSDLLPATLTFVSATSSQGVYDAASGLWTLGTLSAIGATSSATLSIVATVNATGPTSNTASVSASDQPDPNTANNSASASLNGNPLADLGVTKSGPAVLTPGDDVAYLIVITNHGPGAATNIVIADATPAGLIFVDNAGDCIGAYPCALASLASGASATITTTYSVPADYGGASPIVNTVNATSDTPDPDTTNNQAVAQTNVGAGNADLAITKQGPAALASGAAITYTLLIVNNGPSPANGAIYSDNVPVAITGITASCAGELGGAACVSQPVIAGNTVSGTIGTLPSSGSVLITISGTAPQGPVTLANSATIAPPTGINDPAAGNNSSSVSTIVGAPMADLAIEKSAPAAIVPGTDAGYTLTVTNNGPDTALSVQLDDPTPPGMTFVSASAPCEGGFPCALGDVTDGASAIIAVTFAVAADQVGSIDNTATVGAATSDQDPANNSDTVTTPLTPLADLAVVKTGPAQVAAGGAIAYVVVMTNQGPSAVHDATFTDPVPSGISNVVATCGNATGAAICGAVDVGTNNIVSSTIPDLPSGSTLTFTIDGIAPATATTLSNMALAHTPGNVSDPDLSNNTSSVDTAVSVVATSADIGLVKTGPSSVTAGNDIAYAIVVTNNGPDPALSVTIADPTPDGLIFAGNAGACATAYPCALGTLASGASVTITTTYQVPGSYAGPNPLVNTATAFAATPDPNSGNNISVATTTVITPTTTADVAITKTGPATVATNGTITYTLAISNAGPDAADGASYSDPVPSGIVITGANCGGETGGALCAAQPVVSGNLVSGAFGTLPNGGGALITITGVAPANAVTLTNTATVTAPVGTADPNTANNSSSVPTTVQGPTLLDPPFISKSVSAVDAATLLWQIVLINNQNTGALPVELHDPVPAGMNFIGGAISCQAAGSSTVSRCTFDAGNDRIIVGALIQPDPGATDPALAANEIVVTFQAQYAATPTAITNTAEAYWDQNNDGNVGDDIAGGELPVAASATFTPTVGTPMADLVVSKAGPASANAGQTISYSIEVVNHGPDAVPDAVLSDPTPPGLTYLSSSAPCAGGFPCALGGLANAASASVIVTYAIQPGYSGTIVNSATISSASVPDPDPDNNSATATTTIDGGNPGGPVTAVSIDTRWMLALLSLLLMLAGTHFVLCRRP